MHVGNYLGLVHNSEQQLAKAFLALAQRHHQEPDIYQTALLLSSWCHQHVEALKPFSDRYSKQQSPAVEGLRQVLSAPHPDSLALLQDLQDLCLLTNAVHIRWIVLSQVAQALRDEELEWLCKRLDEQTQRQLSWLLTRLKQLAPQILLAAVA